MAITNPPYAYDIVGSFLRPEALKQARADFAAGTITREQLTTAEDAAIADLVEKEKQAGLKAVTDGEFRRAMWHLDFLEGLQNVEHVDAETWSVEFKGPKPKGAQLVFRDKIAFGDHPFLAHFAKLRDIAGDYPVKLTIPAPSMLHLIPCVRGKATYRPIERYADESVLFNDIVEVYRDAVRAFYDLGCRYLQFDDTSWGEFCDPAKRELRRLLPGVRLRPLRRFRPAFAHPRPEGGIGPGHVQVPRAGERGGRDRAHPRGGAVRAARAAAPVHAMRLLLHRGGQRAHRG